MTTPAATVTNGASAPAQDSPAQSPSHKVFAGNLAYATTDEGLKAFFAPVASDILSVQVIYRGTRPAGYGFVAFSSLEAAEKAVTELDRKELDGRSVIVQIAKPAEDKEKDRSEKRASGGKKRVGRRGAKAPLGEVTEAEASGEQETDKANEQSDAQGIDSKSKKAKKSRKPRRPRKEGEDAPATEAAEGDEGEKAKKIKAKRAPRPPRVPRPEGEAPPGEPSKNMLFVANLAFEVDDEGLSAIFTGVGIKVISARVVRRRFGAPVRRSKGFGFVDVGDEAEQKRAIELTQGKEVHGRQIAVKIAVNATKEGEEENGQTEAAEATAA